MMVEQGVPDSDVVDIEIEWSSVPTQLVDQMIGFTNVDGIGRATFGQLAFQPNASKPVGRPVVSLAATLAAWRRMRDQITNLIEVMEATSPVMIDPKAQQ